MRNSLYTIGLLLFSLNLFGESLPEGQNQTAVESYVEKYSYIAQELMVSSGVPASIKLAQGILESNSGRSTLAMEANNHFGIKCGPTWNGPTYYRKDDDRDAKGKLKASCFRVFSSAEESFRLHSEFLRDPRKSYRYGFLFELDPMDYKSWARGLKKSGYATNPKYAQLLIDLIERYELFKYDEIRSAESYASRDTKRQDTKQNHEVSKPSATSTDVKLRKVNGASAFRYRTDMNLAGIARNSGLSLEELKEINEWARGHKVAIGENIFIEEKLNGYCGKSKFHRADGRETVRDIAQLYGLSSVALSRHNKMGAYDRPRKNQKIKLKSVPGVRKRVNRKSTPEVKVEANPTGEYLFEIPLQKKEIENQQEELFLHTVESGETLFSISRLYGVSVDELKRIYKLGDQGLKIGMKLALND